MPYTTELTQDCVGIIHSASGVLTGEELLAASIAATHLVQNTANFQYEFSDFSDVTELQVTPEILQQIVQQDHLAAKWRPHAIIIIAAPHDDAYKLAREWEKNVSELGWTIHISRDRAEAVKWLAKYLKSERPELLAQKKQDVA